MSLESPIVLSDAECAKLELLWDDRVLNVVGDNRTIDPRSDSFNQFPLKDQVAILSALESCADGSKSSLVALRKDIEKSLSTDVAEDTWTEDATEEPAPAESAPMEIPKEITNAAKAAKGEVNRVFDEGQYLSLLRKWIWVLPWMQPSGGQDAGDAIYQSKAFNLWLINWLTAESAKNTPNFDKETRESKEYIGVFDDGVFDSPEKKQEYIHIWLESMAEALKIQDPASDSDWGTWLVLAGGGYIIYKWGKFLLVKKLWGWLVTIASLWAKIVPWLANYIRNRWSAAHSPAPAPHGAPAAGPSTRNNGPHGLDVVSNRMHESVHTSILRELYNVRATAAGTTLLGPNDKVPKDFVTDVTTKIEPALYEKYNDRMKLYAKLGDTPSDAKGIREWQKQLGRIIHGDVTVSRIPFVDRAEKNRQRGNADARATTGQETLRSAVSQAAVKSWSIGGTTFEVSDLTEARLAGPGGLYAWEEWHNEREKELKELIAERDRLKEIQKGLDARFKKEVALESLARDISDLEAKIITQRGEITTQESAIKTAKQAVRTQEGVISGIKSQIEAKTTEINTLPKWDAWIKQLITDRSTLSTTLTTEEWKLGDLRDAFSEAEQEGRTRAGKLNEYIGNLDKKNAELKLASDAYTIEYRTAPRASTITADKMKWLGTAGSHWNGIHEQLIANERAQIDKVRELAHGMTNIERIRGEIETIPEMKGKLNGVTVSDVTITTRIAGGNVEIKSAKGFTEKVATIAQAAFKAGMKK